jgi:hypothetical protein
MTILARSTGDPEHLENPIRQIVRSMDPAQPAPAFTTMEDALSDAVAPLHFTFLLLGIFASVAVVLAAVGLYGLMAYLVDDRTREIGIRVALGADRSQVIRTVVGNGMTLTLIGLVGGFLMSLAAVRLLRTMLYKVSMYDPWTFAAGAVVLALQRASPAICRRDGPRDSIRWPRCARMMLCACSSSPLRVPASNCCSTLATMPSLALLGWDRVCETGRQADESHTASWCWS